ncbi:MAG: nuclear transport factor 2 family protein [Bacteroidetes bacterium]|nr:nuclear transport factor 2 family protein [Bacteroidota bacterium]
MKKGLTIIAIFIFSKTSIAQNISGNSDTVAIKQTINNFFDAMRKGDSMVLRSGFSKGTVLQSIANDQNGNAILSTRTADDFVKKISSPHTAIYDERIVYGTIKIDGDLACVWTPYKFYVGDQFSHCGVNVIQLMKTADGWKIIYIVYTTRNDNCIQ